MRRRRGGLACVALALGVLCSARGARAQDGGTPATEPAAATGQVPQALGDAPPPEAEVGEDYEVALADTLEDDTVEIGVGASGRRGISPRRTRRVRFRGEGLDAAVREGAGDPLSGGVIAGRVAGGTLVAGRLAPRWGRGIVLGAPAEPWDARARDRGTGAGRAGEGLCFSAGGRTGFETLAGTFERRRVGGARLWRGPWHAGGMSDLRRRAQNSVGFAGDADEVELAMDQRGRWRLDALRARPAAGGSVELHARAGAPGFRSLAEPRRSGPAQALTLRYAGEAAPAVRAIASWWRFRPGLAGARAALQLTAQTPSGSAVLALEEQHGPRRAGASLASQRGMRQGAWGEWSARTAGLALSLRHEVWGGQRLRRAVRRASGVHVETTAPGGARLRVAHTAFQAGFGESLYLREAYADRLVLRALSGRGTRTFVECRLPAAGGRLTLSMQVTRRRGAEDRIVWTLDWARSARTRR